MQIKPFWLPDAAFDMNGDSIVNQDDHRVWVNDVTDTWYGYIVLSPACSTVRTSCWPSRRASMKMD